MNLPALLRRARHSGLARRWLNAVLPWMIPFNRPHGFAVRPMPDGGMRVTVPHWRINRNHIRGIHACALATAAEMCSGLAVLERIDPKRYRLIMRELRMQYGFQAKQDVDAECPSLEAQLDEAVERLRLADAAECTAIVQLRDRSGNAVATGTITWQLKPWDKVRTPR
jgi:acyl-coenzyme A thioesterase PaaI-like protein